MSFKDIKDNKRRSSLNNGSTSLVNGKTLMAGKSKKNLKQEDAVFTPYKKMEEEDEDFYPDNLSDLHNISIAEAYEHKCDVRKTVISTILLILMGTIITLVVIYREDILEKMNDFMDLIKENPCKTTFIYFIVMTLMISASVPSAIPQVSGSYLFVQAFGFIKGFLLMVVVDYFAMLIG